jgi:hypothetical protein
VATSTRSTQPRTEGRATKGHPREADRSQNRAEIRVVHPILPTTFPRDRAAELTHQDGARSMAGPENSIGETSMIEATCERGIGAAQDGVPARPFDGRAALPQRIGESCGEYLGLLESEAASAVTAKGLRLRSETFNCQAEVAGTPYSPRKRRAWGRSRARFSIFRRERCAKVATSPSF